MPGPNFVLDKGFQATAAIPQFSVVVASTTNKEQCTVAGTLGAQVLGVCQDNVTTLNATNGRIANIRLMGISRCIAAGAIGLDVRVRVDATGRVTPLAAATANQNQVGVTRTAAAAAGDLVDIQLTPYTQITVP